MPADAPNEPRFRPWCPTNASKGFEGVKLLILGESHYEETPDWIDDGRPLANTYTQDIIETWGINPSERKLFFANIFATLANKKWSKSEDLELFWNSIYFYNYVQRLVPGGARHSPTTDMWKEGHLPFRHVLEELKPDAILVLGQRLWKNMTKEDGWAEDLGSPMGWISFYETINKKSIYAARINHPSSTGFSPTFWHDGTMKYLQWVLSRM